MPWETAGEAFDSLWNIQGDGFSPKSKGFLLYILAIMTVSCGKQLPIQGRRCSIDTVVRESSLYSDLPMSASYHCISRVKLFVGSSIHNHLLSDKRSTIIKELSQLFNSFCLQKYGYTGNVFLYKRRRAYAKSSGCISCIKGAWCSVPRACTCHGFLRHLHQAT